MNWPSVKLKEIFDIARGGSPRPIAQYITEDPDGLNWISIKDASNSGKYITKTKQKIRKEGLVKSRLVKPGDFLLTNSMSFGRPYIMKTTGCIHDGWLVLSSDPERVNQDYFYYLLGSDLLHHKFSRLAAGAVVKNLNIDLVKGVTISLPPLPEQKKIAEILDVADSLRQKDQQLTEHYDTLSQSLFLDMFGDPVNNQKQWGLKEFGEIYKSLKYGVSTPPVYLDSGIPFIRATNVKKGGVVEKGMVFISLNEAKKISKCKLSCGDLIVVRSGANTGDCCRIPSNYDGAYGGFDMIIKINEPFSTFYNFLLNTEAGKAILKPLTRRAGQPHLNSQQMYSLNLIAPPIAIQKQFTEHLNKIEKQKQQAQVSLQKSEDLFNSLLQKAFKGELTH